LTRHPSCRRQARVPLGAFAHRQLSRWEIIKANPALILATP
jgi:hypothetical protein